MKLEWMGKYRDLVEAVIRYGNSYAGRYQKERYMGADATFSPAQLQVMEYILENEEKNQSMVEVATRLGISPSAFSKNVKRMTEKGLLEKYHTVSNRKNVIVRASARSREVYQQYTKFALDTLFGEVFAVLDDIPPKYIERFTDAINVWTRLSSSEDEQEAEAEALIKIE